MDIGTALVADAESAKAVQAAQCAFDHPSPFTQAFARLNAVAGYAWNDATAAQLGPMGTQSVGLVGMQFGRTFAWTASKTCYWRDGFKQGNEHSGIMYLSPRYARHQRKTALIDEQMVLASELAAVGGIGTSMLSAEGGMARWPSRHWRVPTEFGRIPASAAAWRHGCVASYLPVAIDAGAASNSCRCRSPVYGEDIPKASLS